MKYGPRVTVETSETLDMDEMEIKMLVNNQNQAEKVSEWTTQPTQPVSISAYFVIVYFFAPELLT